MTQRIKPYEVLKSYENIPSWRNIFPQLEKNISLTGEKYFLSYGKYVTKVTQKNNAPGASLRRGQRDHYNMKKYLIRSYCQRRT